MEPWRDAVAIERLDDPTDGDLPGIVAWMTRPDGRMNAEEIVRAVNQHDDLIAVLRTITENEVITLRMVKLLCRFALKKAGQP